MPDHDLRTTIDALCARLQSELHTQAAEWSGRLADERETARREADTRLDRAEAQSAARLEALREEWQGRLTAGLADAAADAERRLAAEGRLAAEAERARLEVENLAKAAADVAERHRQELETLREEWQGRLQAGMADAAAEADRRVIAETDRVRREVEQAAVESNERVREEVRRDMEHAARESSAQLRAEMAQAATHSSTLLRAELEQATAHATERLREAMKQEMNEAVERERAQAVATERERAGAEIEGERARVQTLLAAERDRSAAEVEAERLKTQALTAALEEAQAAVSTEREAARSAAASLEATRQERDALDAQAVIDLRDARVAEREAQLVVVERLLGGVRTIDGARSLSDTLTNLTHAAASVAPRAALFIVVNGVKGRELQGWKAAGFAGESPATLHFSADDRAARGLLDLAVLTGRAVATTMGPAPSFAKLPQDRAGLAVPVTVGGQSVAVLYADDASAAEPEAPASWPEAIQLLAAHASSCLAQITAVRTTQAMQQMSNAGGTRSMAAGSLAGGEDDSSARRYARLLVSEIKLYNEAAVRTGREKRDLLNRLGPEIDRARRLYEERVSPSVGARATYFQQELVHTLADGDSALLGGVV